VGSVLLLVIFQSAKISSIVVILDKTAYPTDDHCFSLFLKKEKILDIFFSHHFGTSFLIPHSPCFFLNRSLGRRVARSVLLVSAMVEVEHQPLFLSSHKKY
jgi:hypothetical protein